MTKDWNEIQFLSWDEFSRMAPSILQLEVTRIGTLLRSGSLKMEDHNALVRVRHAIKQFIECAEKAQKETIQASCEPLLTQALLNVPAIDSRFDMATAQTIEYIVDRLKYVIHRIPLIY